MATCKTMGISNNEHMEQWIFEAVGVRGNGTMEKR